MPFKSSHKVYSIMWYIQYVVPEKFRTLKNTSQYWLKNFGIGASLLICCYQNVSAGQHPALADCYPENFKEAPTQIPLFVLRKLCLFYKMRRS